MDDLWFYHVHLTDSQGLSRTNFDFLTDASLTLTDFNGQILILSRTSQGRSRTLTDEIWFSHGPLTEDHGLPRMNFDFPTDAHGLSRTNFLFPTDTSRTLTDFGGRILIFKDFRGRILISPRIPYWSSWTLRTIFVFYTVTSRTLTDFHGQILH